VSALVDGNIDRHRGETGVEAAVAEPSIWLHWMASTAPRPTRRGNPSGLFHVCRFRVADARVSSHQASV
jgi:hypothetical protein